MTTRNTRTEKMHEYFNDYTTEMYEALGKHTADLHKVGHISDYGLVMMYAKHLTNELATHYTDGSAFDAVYDLIPSEVIYNCSPTEIAHLIDSIWMRYEADDKAE